MCNKEKNQCRNSQLSISALEGAAALGTTMASGSSLTIATLTTTAPAWGPFGWVGLTTTTMTTIALPVSGVIAAAYIGCKAYQALSSS